MWEVTITCIALVTTCLAQAFEPQPTYVATHVTRSACIKELDRVAKVFNVGNGAYSFSCRPVEGNRV